MSHPRAALAALLGLFALLALPGALAESVTADEPLHVSFGYRALARGDFERRVYGEMPWSALPASPGFLLERSGEEFFPDPRTNVPSRRALLLGRLVTLAAGLSLGGALAALAHLRAGWSAALATAALFALDPNLLAHAHLATLDVPASAFAALSVLAAIRLRMAPSLARAAALGAAIGGGLATKATQVHVVLGLAAGLGACVWAERREKAVLSGKRTAALAATIVLAACVVLDAAYFFRGLPGHLPDPARSDELAKLSGSLAGLPLPVSSRFLEGLDGVLYDRSHRAGFGPLYLLGDLDTTQRGWPHYYLVVGLVKLPLPLFALLALALAGALGRGPAAERERPTEGRGETIIFSAVVVELLAYFLIVHRVQIGIRHLLPALALLLVPAGRTLAKLFSGSQRARALGVALVAWQALSVLSFFPDFIPYTNELVPDRKLAYRILADSNLDWGQGDEQAREFVAEEAAKGHVVHVSPETPVTGTVLVSVNELVGISFQPGRYAWLRGERPLGHVAHAWLIFEVK